MHTKYCILKNSFLKISKNNIMLEINFIFMTQLQNIKDIEDIQTRAKEDVIPHDVLKAYITMKTYIQENNISHV